MSTIAEPATVWEWRSPAIPGQTAKTIGYGVASLGLGGALFVWGVAAVATGTDTNIRYLLVVGLLLFVSGVFAFVESRRARQTVVRIDRLGSLHVVKGTKTESVDLRDATQIEIRSRRLGTRWTDQWSIEVVKPGGAWHSRLDNVASFWKQPESEIRRVEGELERWRAWAASSSSGRVTAPTGVATAVRGTETADASRLVWRPPPHPNRARNRRRLRIGIVGFALLIAAFAAVSSWSDGAAAVFFSMFVPVLILVLGFGFDRIYDLGKNFRIEVDSAALTVVRGRGGPTVVPLGEITLIDVDLRTTHGPDSSESSAWYLAVGRRSERPIEVILPTFLGSAFGRDDAIALEAELRRRCRLA